MINHTKEDGCSLSCRRVYSILYSDYNRKTRANYIMIFTNQRKVSKYLVIIIYHNYKLILQLASYKTYHHFEDIAVLLAFELTMIITASPFQLVIRPLYNVISFLAPNNFCPFYHQFAQDIEVRYSLFSSVPNCLQYVL